MRGLYAIVDFGALSARSLDPLGFAQAVLRVRPAALQVRAKGAPAREVLALLRALVPLCRQMKTPLVANDRADLAALAGCDFVHIGQEDIPIELVRRIAPGLRVGISTHNPEQLQKALDAKPDYVAYGPVYPTANKVQADPVVGLDGLRMASEIARGRGVPIVAIGGISIARASEIAPIADAAAVIGDLLPSESGISGEAQRFQDVIDRAEALHAALRGNRNALEAKA